LGSLLAATYAGLATVAFLGAISPWQMLIGCMVSGSYWAIDTPVRRTMIAEIAGPRSIGTAMTFELSTSNLTRMLGPATGGLLYQRLGMAGIYALGVMLSVGSAVLVWRTLAGGRADSNSSDRHGAVATLSSVREGLRYIKTDGVVRALLYSTIVINVFCISYVAAVPVIGSTALKLNAWLTGLLMSAEGVGSFLGGVLIGILSRPRQFEWIFVTGSTLYLVGVLAFSVAENFPLAFAFLFAAGLGAAAFGTMQSTLVLARTPYPLRHQVMGVLTVCVGSGPLGVIAVGLLMAILDARSALLILASAGLLCLGLVVLRWPALHGSLPHG
jgi:MFS family permease